jgi:hypothetical protein
VTTFTRVPRLTLLIATSVLILIAELFANFVIAPGLQQTSVGGWIGYSVFGIAVTAVLLLVAVPRIPRENRTMFVLGFGIAAIVTCAIYRTALPFAFGAAALAAAAPGDDSPEGSGAAPSTAGVLLGCLAIVAAFVLSLIS